MPTYDYKCDDCGVTFEKFQSIKAASLKKCPECGKNHLRRLIGPGAGLIFKGSGFYATDYRSDAYKTAAKSDSGTTSESTAKPSTTDTKPATATPNAETKPAKTEKASRKSEK